MERGQFIAEFCKELQYRCYSDQDKVCRYGEYGDEFYLIVEGKVKIFTPKTLQLQLPEAYEPLSNLLLGPKLEDVILYGKGIEMNQKYEIPLANG